MVPFRFTQTCKILRDINVAIALDCGRQCIYAADRIIRLHAE